MPYPPFGAAYLSCGVIAKAMQNRVILHRWQYPLRVP
jgi:hypothetical protein